MNDAQIKIRSFILKGLILAAFLVLTAQLWNLQIVQGETYRELADANRFRLNEVSASRGVIYDSNGELLVRNRPVYNVIIIPAYLPEDATAEARVFSRLSELLNLPITTDIDPTGSYNNGYFHAIGHHQYFRQPQRQIINPRSRRYINEPQGIRDAVGDDRVFAPFLPVIVAEDVDPLIVARIEEERLNLPGVLVEIAPSREYLHDELLSHILGYTGPIPAERFEQYEAQGYGLTDITGLAGLEIQYETWLRGVKGLENIEVDVTGQKIRTVSQSVEARPGHNLRLSLDLGLQEATAEALQAAMDEVNSQQGVAIAMNPQNGEILSMVSLPSYDNNLFSRGISLRELALLSEDPQAPLVDHAIAGLYPPGSIFKIIPASGGLQEGTLTPETTFVDEGVLYLPNQFDPDNLDLAQPFFCWLRSGHGPVNVVSALAWSCNVFFYQAGGGYYPANYDGLGLSNLGQYAQQFGLGEITGIDLPGEISGLVPNEKWKRVNYAEQWLTGDTYNMAIGQGFVLVTPLQMANAYAAIANGGTLYRPHLVKEILDGDGNLVRSIEPEAVGELQLSPEVLTLVRDGLFGAINWENGTAADYFDVPGITAAGKTGTAEFCDNYPACLDRDGRVRTSHAWFVTYAPASNPEIVVIVFVYGGKQGAGVAVQGSEVAVPVASEILRYYFNIADEEDPDGPQTDDSDPVTLDVDTEITARLLGTDTWSQDGANLSGFILDAGGRPIADVAVEILINGEVAGQVTSSDNGQFDYNSPDTTEIEPWQVRLADYPNAPSLKIEASRGVRYLVEFEAVAPQETASTLGSN